MTPTDEQAAGLKQVLDDLRNEAAEDFAAAVKYALLNCGAREQRMAEKAFLAGVIYKRGKELAKK